ncbi:energy transducer TonB [Commensalibacter oyaizuii]|uniref:TonB family protein n=1 Tax=Commensalibacter oyaizuii TaxID=3043873 RepID=A0ABT6PYV0_9PROT|nr:energy transducer TonB [Commensalibacter sp. TBRC 16381]MDI2089905.1 TonB family protein [Commensalibacter sp. TBRC 16381]
MTHKNRPLIYKTVTAHHYDRFVGYIIPSSPDAYLRPEFIKRLKSSEFVSRPTTYVILLTGHHLLHKEPADSRTSVHHTTGLAFNSYVPSSDLPSSFHLHSLYPKVEKKRFFPSSGSIASTIIHLLILVSAIIVFIKFFEPSFKGNNEQGQPVDMVFLPQNTGSSGLTGEGLNGEDGKPLPPPSQQQAKTISPPENTKPLPPPSPTNEELSAPPIEQTIPKANADPIPVPKEKTNNTKKQPTKNHTYAYRYTPPRQKRIPQRRTTPQSNSPFANMSNLDFSENPSKSKRHAATKKIPQGSRSSIDLSTGPLVKNGKINVPYAAKISIKGVSDDYGQALNNWIQRHMYYPIEALKNGEAGSPSVHVAISRDGQVTSVTLTNSSGSDALDTAITGMFRGATLPKIPPDLPDHFELDLTINYILLRR